ncbi:MAG: peptidase M17 [Spirochaetales bacterium]|nr:MAG: peptidase M17 [Spirochaetales bacterium]
MESLHDAALAESARITVTRVLNIKPGERALIVTNPSFDVFTISQYLYNALTEAGASAVMLVQPRKSQLDFAEEAVLAALASEPDAVLSISAGKIGKDRKGIAEPYTRGRESYTHIFDYLLYGKKSIRSVWSPSITLPIFSETVALDYDELRNTCLRLKALLDRAESVFITNAAGTRFKTSLKNRLGQSDDGDFTLPGSGGNLPAGEVFISPVVGASSGTIVFDGSISSHKGEIIIKEPVFAEVADGYVTDLSGGPEAAEVEESLRLAAEKAFQFEKAGNIPAGKAELYAKNARNIGEVGIGLNPKARIIGNMLVDEKVTRTCHIAIGHNYEDDAPALIHLDGLVKNPTMELTYEDGSKQTIMDQGNLLV